MVLVWMTFSDLLKVTIVQRQITPKCYYIELYLQWPTNRKSLVYRTALFSMTLNDHIPSFKVTPFFDAEYLRNNTTYIHSFNEILMGTCTHPTQQFHFEWSWMTLSDLAQYSMTRSVAQSLCDSWAFCNSLPARQRHTINDENVAIEKCTRFWLHPRFCRIRVLLTHLWFFLVSTEKIIYTVSREKRCHW